MRRPLGEILAGLLLCGICVSQDAPAPPRENSTPAAQQTPAQQTDGQQPDPNRASEPPRRIAPGSVIPAQLTKTLDAKKVKTGDEVEAKVTQDLKTVNGELIVPKDTKLVGHITEAQARTKEQKESEIGIAFDHTVMKDGTAASVPMSIQAVIAPPSQNSENNSAGPASAPQAGPPQAGGGGMSPDTRGGRSGTAGGAQQQMPGSYPSGEDHPAPPAGSPAHSVTANTQGVVGMSDYSLSTPGDETKGSVVSSEKNNVKLESGTMLLLKVNQ